MDLNVSGEACKELIGSVDVFMFDCDGVLFQGSTVIPNVPETLSLLRKHGKRIFFVTNNATKSRADNAKKLSDMGIEAHVDEVICSAFSAASFVKHKGVSGKVYVVGESGLMDEMKMLGLDACGGPEHANRDWKEANEIEIDPNVRAVVVGLDRSFSYYKMSYACLHLQPHHHNVQHEVLFVATNKDATFPAEGRRKLPGAGSLVTSIETSSQRQAIVVGKPSAWFVELVQSVAKADPARAVMVGDRLDTDIAFGRLARFKTLLVTETGVHDVNKMNDAPADSKPDYHARSITTLLSVLREM